MSTEVQNTTSSKHDAKLPVSSSKRFKCRNCGARSVNSGAFFKGSNESEKGRLCYKCEKAWAEQNAEDNSWYNSVRM